MRVLRGLARSVIYRSAIGGSLLLVVLGGCQGRTVESLDPEEYGEILYKTPRLPEAERPYNMPQLKGLPKADDLEK